MWLIDFILNLASLLLWLNWRALPLDPLATATPPTFVGTLRRAEPARVKRWYFLAALVGLLLLRAWLCWQLGPALNWTARLNLFATRLAFKSDFFGLMLLYSALSFGLMLGIFLLWLLLLSMLGRDDGNNPLPIRLARAHLGFAAQWAAWQKLLLPLAAGFVFVVAAHVAALRVGLDAATNFADRTTRTIRPGGLERLSGLEISHRRTANAPSAAPLRIFRATSVLELRGYRRAPAAASVAGPADPRGKGGFDARGGNRPGLSPGVLCRNRFSAARLDTNGRHEVRTFEIPGLIDLYERVAR